jgi:hypothetical protein
MASKHDTYGEYVPSPATQPVPPFPCQENSCCTASNRLCSRHQSVLFVLVFMKKTTESSWERFEIPYGHWEDWEWYGNRISEVTGLSTTKFRMLFAGREQRPGEPRHSGLQKQSTIHCMLKEGI